ncbi:MAG: DUF1326 domain-containing protein [Planctomycetes bacterium]|nr:DUF1326 domain-containing protein [Planctomycetota bacterium]
MKRVLRRFVRNGWVHGLAMLSLFLVTSRAGAEIRGTYLETRSCQVYTGPCFANSEIGLTGNDAILAWSVDEGTYQQTDLAGLSVVMVLRANDTLANAGIGDPTEVRSMIIVDENASSAQRDALVEFVKSRTGRAGENVVAVKSAPIVMKLDQVELTGELRAGSMVKLTTRKARKGDCICSNEIAYYPPLTELRNFVPGVSMEAEFNGRGLGIKWSTPNSRSAYMGVFEQS